MTLIYRRLFNTIYQFLFGWSYWLVYVSGGNFVRRAFLKTRGKNVKISPTAFLKYPKNIVIGDNTFINHNCCVWAAENGPITIGKDVIFGPGVCVIASNHGIKRGRLIREQEDVDAPIVIGDDVWLGTNVTVTAGVTIGNGCVVGANAVVTKSLPPYSVCVGIPAKVIHYRKDNQHD